MCENVRASCLSSKRKPRSQEGAKPSWVPLRKKGVTTTGAILIGTL